MEECSWFCQSLIEFAMHFFIIFFTVDLDFRGMRRWVGVPRSVRPPCSSHIILHSSLPLVPRRCSERCAVCGFSV